METGIELIAKERQEQIDKHGFCKNHDTIHEEQDLSYNAAILASPVILYYQAEDLANQVTFQKCFPYESWKLPPPNTSGNVLIDNIKLSKKKRIKQLVVAGALIAAEIDRLNHPTLK